jgi:hypothetical protein
VDVQYKSSLLSEMSGTDLHDSQAVFSGTTSLNYHQLCGIIVSSLRGAEWITSSSVPPFDEQSLLNSLTELVPDKEEVMKGALAALAVVLVISQSHSL